MPKFEPFSPADMGTPENAWRSLLGSSAGWQPTPGSLIVVAPHPDDEVLGAGGLLHSWALAGQHVTVLSVTDGEAADPRRADLSLVRRAELRNALRRLSLVHVQIERLGLPDGRVGDHTDRLRTALREHTKKRSTIIAPFEHDGHPDHEAVGQVCLEVARSAAITIARYPIWAWHQANPETLRGMRWGLFRLKADDIRAKARAIQCFDSQLRPPEGLPVVPPHVLTHFTRPYEAFLL
jgi:LmbE family N-acetylglucosaminyl deacetylase